MGQSAETKRAIASGDWRQVSKIFKLDDDKFIKENIENLNFSTISTRDDLTLNFLNKYQYKIDWTILCKNKTINIPIIELCSQFPSFVRWGDLAQYMVLSDGLIFSYFTKFNSTQLVKYQKLSPQVLHTYWDSFDTTLILKHQRITNKELSRMLNEGSALDTIGVVVLNQNHEYFYECSLLWELFLQYWVKVKGVGDSTRILSKSLDFGKIHADSKFITHDLIELDGKWFSVNFSKNTIFPDEPSIETIKILEKYARQVR